MSLLDDLQAIPTQQQVLDQDVVPQLQRDKVRVTDWFTGAVVRSISYVAALFGVQVRTLIATALASSFETFAFGDSPSPNGIDVTVNAPVIAANRYGLTQILASPTRRQIVLTNTSSSSYGPLLPGSMKILFALSGNRYVLDGTAADATASITIPANGNFTAAFRSEFVVNSTIGRIYNDDSDATIVLVTNPYPGVTATNPAPAFKPTVLSGSGLGTVTPSGSPDTDSGTITVRIDASGNAGDSSVGWSTSPDGDSDNFTAQSGATATVNGITLTLADNAGNPAFISGALYFVTWPGSDVISLGRDVETAPQLGARCRGLIALVGFPRDANGIILPLSPTKGGYEAIVRSMNDQIVNVLVQTDGQINNRVNILMAGQGAPLPSDVLSSVQGALLALNMITDDPRVKAITPRSINFKPAVTTVYVKASQLASAQSAMQNAFAAYLSGTDPHAPFSINGAPNGAVDRAYLVGLIRDTPGVTKTDADTTLQIGHNGGSFAAADLQLPTTIGAFELATWTSEFLSSVFTWIPK